MSKCVQQQSTPVDTSALLLTPLFSCWVRSVLALDLSFAAIIVAASPNAHRVLGEKMPCNRRAVRRGESVFIMEGGSASSFVPGSAKQYPVRCSGCDKVASSLRCPTCVKIGLPDSYWCGQDCFKSSWNAHKGTHAVYVEADGGWADRRFRDFPYTGKLRKGKEGPRRPVPASIPRPVYVNSLGGLDPRETDAKREKVIACNTAKEVAVPAVGGAMVIRHEP